MKYTGRCVVLLPSKWVVFKRESGGALISALVLVLLVTLVAAQVQKVFTSVIGGLESSLARQQSHLIMASTPELVASFMSYDKDAKVDGLNDIWLTQGQSFPVDDLGVISVSLFDDSAKFNINSLVVAGSDAEALHANQAFFIRLIMALPELGIDTQQARDLSFNIRDWLDVDSISSQPGSAESDYYQGLSPVRHRAANQLMHSPTELRMVKGVTPEIYRALAPYITARDNSEHSININTASRPILRAINGPNTTAPVAESIVQQWEEARAKEDFKSVQDFLALPSVQQLQGNGQEIAQDMLRVNSEYLTLNTDLKYLGRMYIMTAMFSRDGDDITLLKKSYGDL